MYGNGTIFRGEAGDVANILMMLCHNSKVRELKPDETMS